MLSTSHAELASNTKPATSAARLASARPTATARGQIPVSSGGCAPQLARLAVSSHADTLSPVSASCSRRSTRSRRSSIAAWRAPTDAGSARREQPVGQRLFPGVQTRRRQQLEERPVAEQIEVRGVGMLRAAHTPRRWVPFRSSGPRCAPARVGRPPRHAGRDPAPSARGRGRRPGPGIRRPEWPATSPTRPPTRTPPTR